MNIPVLMYHQVETERGAPSDFVVSLDVMRRQLTYLYERGYTTPSIGAALQSKGRDAQQELLLPPRVAQGEQQPRRQVLITFDDGYLDNYTVALPLLLEFGYRATVFCVANHEQRVNFWDAGAPTGRAELMGPAHLRAMVAAGIEIGSHGITHRRLTQLDDAAVERELRDSKAMLEDVVGVAVDYFAYPYGAVTPRVKELVAAAGYRAAFAVNSGPFDFHADPFEIRRVLVGDHDEESYLYAKTSGLEKAARTSTTFCRRMLTTPIAGLLA